MDIYVCRNQVMPPILFTSQDQTSKSVELRPTFFAKILMLGDYNVGKTSLASSFCYDKKNNWKTSTLSTFHWTDMVLDNQIVRMCINDTGGQERYRSLTASYYRGAHGCLILFDVTKHHTFENVSSWLTDLRQYSMYPEKVSTIIVGTRCHSAVREVSKEKAEAFADHVGIPYMEVSSEENINVREVFDLLADNIIHAFKRHPSMVEVQQTTRLSANQTKQKFSWCSC